jgi:uncharacterized damage-inducible protein DinB
MDGVGDPLNILLQHDRWGTRQVLDACTALTSEQFNQRFEIGPGSLHDTLGHIIGAMQRWTIVLQTGGTFPTGPRLEETARTPAAYIDLLPMIADGFAEAVYAHPLDQIINVERNGQTFDFSRGGIATHVATHGMYHRAQCINMLRRLGGTKLPGSSVTEWMRQDASHR